MKRPTITSEPMISDEHHRHAAEQRVARDVVAARRVGLAHVRDQMPASAVRAGSTAARRTVESPLKSNAVFWSRPEICENARERLEARCRRRARDDLAERVDEVDAQHRAAGAALREHRVDHRQPELHLHDADLRAVIANDARELDDRALRGRVGRCLRRGDAVGPRRLPPAFVALHEVATIGDVVTAL